MVSYDTDDNRPVSDVGFSSVIFGILAFLFFFTETSVLARSRSPFGKHVRNVTCQKAVKQGQQSSSPGDHLAIEGLSPRGVISRVNSKPLSC
jgi:hypothetical protein